MRAKVIILFFLSLISSFSIFAQDDSNASLKIYELLQQADDRLQSDNPAEALVLLQEAQELANQQSGLSEEQGLVLHKIGNYHYSSGDYPTAIVYFNLALELMKKVLGENHPDYANSLNNVGACYSALGDYHKAIEYHSKALEIRKSVYGENHPDYANSLNNVGVCYSALGDYHKAIEYHNKALEIRKSVYGENHPTYANSLHSLGEGYAYLGDYNKAIEYGSKALEICKSIYSENHPDHAENLILLRGCYTCLGDYKKAIEYGNKALEICKSVYGENHPNYATSLSAIGIDYSHFGDYRKAIKYHKKALEIRKSVFGENHPDYAASLLWLGWCYSTMGDYQKAIEYEGKALEICKSVYGENHPDYATSLSATGECYAYLGDYQKAIEYEGKALEIRKSVFGENHPVYANSLNNVGACYSALGNYHKAIEYHSKALEIRKSVYGENHPDYANSLHSIGECYAYLGDYQKAIEYGSKALEICKSIYSENHLNYAASLHLLGSCYFIFEDYDKAIQYHERALNIREEILGMKHPNYINSLGILSAILYSSNNIEAFSRQNQKYIELSCDDILNNFSYLTASQRSSYWDKYSYNISNRQYYYTYYLREDAVLLQSTYDCVLLSKGILLNAETELRDLILNSNDEVIVDLYDKFTLEKRQLAHQLEKPISERTMPTDSLEAVCDRLEKQLLENCKVFGDYTKNLAIKWTDVQSKLGKSDIAIEFIEVPISKDTTKYCALVLKKGYDAPHFVELFDLKDLQNLYAKYSGQSNRESGIYKDSRLFDLVWKPLSKELEGVQNIYFGPAGELYQVAIEYADNGNGPFSTQKNLYRLSSTRQLAVVRDPVTVKTSSVYGGLNYGESMDALIADSKRYPQKRSIEPDYFFNVDSLNVRDLLSRSLDVKELPGTLEEATSITKLMNEAKISATSLIGDDGTEAAFKAKSGTEQNILHIGTHGFYWTETEADKVGKFLNRPELMSVGTGNKRVEDHVLSRSGLLFAGVNNAFKKGYQKEKDIDDGILTAKEIAMLDLKGTDLVTLSACQTGLGEISGEGVFGLQRGFKKAGVNAILMSLWKVDDEATSMLMCEFYRNYLVRNMTLRESLCEAQKTVRDFECEIEEDLSSDSILIDRLNNNDGRDTATTKKTKIKKFNDPAYWAGFVLLDGLDK